MIYKSENGSSFGVDSMFLLYKEKHEIKIKQVLQARWHLHVDRISVNEGILRVEYTADDQKSVVEVPIEELDGLETKTTLSDTDKVLLKMYQDNQFIFRDSGQLSHL